MHKRTKALNLPLVEYELTRLGLAEHKGSFVSRILLVLSRILLLPRCWNAVRSALHATVSGLPWAANRLSACRHRCFSYRFRA